MIKVSVVICTRNRSAQLKKCLMSFLYLKTEHPFELIVVDNGSCDDTRKVLAEFSKSSPFPLVTLFESVPGSGRARNTGWKAASGSIVAFTDDDCYPAVDWIDNIALCFEESAIGFLGGKVELYDPSDLPVTIQRKETAEHIPAFSYIPAGLIHGANFSFRKEALISVNGFDPHLGAGTPFPSEDVEILARLTAKGWTGKYDPRPLVYHHHGRKTRLDLQYILKQYDCARGAYYAKGILLLPTRRAFVKHWYWTITKKSLRSGRFLREVIGFGRYLAILYFELVKRHLV